MSKRERYKVEAVQGVKGQQKGKVQGSLNWLLRPRWLATVSAHPTKFKRQEPRTACLQLRRTTSKRLYITTIKIQINGFLFINFDGIWWHHRQRWKRCSRLGGPRLWSPTQPVCRSETTLLTVSQLRLQESIAGQCRGTAQ